LRLENNSRKLKKHLKRLKNKPLPRPRKVKILQKGKQQEQLKKQNGRTFLMMKRMLSKLIEKLKEKKGKI